MILADPPPPAPHVLLVEDDAALCIAAGKALKLAGFRVTEAHSTMAALAVLDRPDAVDLLVTDVRMPRGQPHGFTLARLARARRPSLRVLYLTGYPELAAEDDAAAFGKLLTKPVDVYDLVREVSAALAARPGAA